jgi:transposase
MARMSHRYPQELRERAIRLVCDSRDQYESEWKAIESVATKLGIGSTETLRKWIRKAEVDAGQRPGVTSQESAEVRKLRAEVRELRRANETSHAVILSSGVFGGGVAHGSKGDRFVVDLAGVEAVVKDAEEQFPAAEARSTA